MNNTKLNDTKYYYNGMILNNLSEKELLILLMNDMDKASKDIKEIKEAFYKEKTFNKN